jgi:drug/metabolite transporter (DMT)-like permease
LTIFSPSIIRTSLPVAALVFNALVWGISWWPFRQLQAAGVHPLWATGLMFGLATIGLLLLRPRALHGWAAHPQLWWLALAAGITNMAFNWAVTTGDVVRVVLLFYLMPAWAVLLAWWLLDEKPTLRHLGQLALAMAGVALVVAPASFLPLALGGSDTATPTTASPTGLAITSGFSIADALAVIGGAGFALTNVLLRRLHAAPDDARAFAMFGGGVSTALIAAAGATAAGLLPGLPPLAWGWLAIIAVMALLFLAGNYALQYGAARLAAGTTALVMLSEVLFASSSSAWLGQTQLTGTMIAGGFCIMMGALLATRTDAVSTTTTPRPSN